MTLDEAIAMKKEHDFLVENNLLDEDQPTRWSWFRGGQRAKGMLDPFSEEERLLIRISLELVSDEA